MEWRIWASPALQPCSGTTNTALIRRLAVASPTRVMARRAVSALRRNGSYGRSTVDRRLAARSWMSASDTAAWPRIAAAATTQPITAATPGGRDLARDDPAAARRAGGAAAVPPGRG